VRSRSLFAQLCSTDTHREVRGEREAYTKRDEARGREGERGWCARCPACGTTARPWQEGEADEEEAEAEGV
jgi:hypothetical protein